MIDQILIDILASDRIFKEGFSNNQRIGSSESFEEHFSQELIKMGFTDYTDEWLLFRVDRNTKTFCDYDSKGEANAYIKQFKDLLEVDPFTTVKMLKPDMGFIEQPLSSKRQPDVLIWWTGKDGHRKYLLVDIKTGGGLFPKVNDRLVHRDHLIIFNSRNAKVKDKPTTITFARDIFDDEDYQKAENDRQVFEEWKKDTVSDTNRTIRFNPRARVEICRLANDWFNEDREKREQQAIDFIRRKL
jgi:hypothetical protein